MQELKEAILEFPLVKKPVAAIVSADDLENALMD
jgi:hypothetical protein